MKGRHLSRRGMLLAAATGGAASAGGALATAPTSRGANAFSPNAGLTVLQTDGYWSPGDSGAARYRKVPAEPAHDGKLRTADGTWWELAEAVIRPEMFGARRDGRADDAPAIISALEYARGRPVVFSAGVYRITRPLSAARVADIAIEGVASAYMADSKGPIDPDSDRYDEPPPAWIAEQHAVILCDGCCLVGEPDTIGQLGASSALRSARNLVVWGTNGAQIGIYIKEENFEIVGVMLVLFRAYGILSRGAGIARITGVATIDCGWGLPASGILGRPNTYNSGCGLKLVANLRPGDYTSVAVTERPTTLILGPFFAGVRGHTGRTASGFRTLQAHGLVSFIGQGVGGYSGVLLELCTGTMDGYHVESYALHGAHVGDERPAAIFCLDCSMVFGEGYAATMSWPALDPWVFVETGIPTVHPRVYRPLGGAVREAGPFRPNTRMSIRTTAARGARYMLPNMASAVRGVAGLATLQLTHARDRSIYGRWFGIVANHKAGEKGWQPMPSQLLAQHASWTGPQANSLEVTWDKGDLVIAVQWGSAWRPGEEWIVDCALVGAEPAGLA